MNQALLVNKKRKALDYFQNRLLKSEIASSLDKIILFGSLAEGTPRKESDIDLLLFGRKPKKISEVSADIAFETAIEYGESIEPLVYPPNDYHSPKSAFLIKTIKQGRELYSS